MSAVGREAGRARGRTHQAAESLEGAWDAHMGVDLDEHAFGGVDVDLEQAGLVQGRVEEGEQTLGRSMSANEGHRQASRTLTWWVMSGRASAMSLPVLARMPWWSSQLRRAYLTSPSRPFFPRALLVTR